MCVVYHYQMLFFALWQLQIAGEMAAMNQPQGGNQSQSNPGLGQFHLGAASYGDPFEDLRNLAVEQLRGSDGRFFAEGFIPRAALPSLSDGPDGMLMITDNTQFSWAWGSFNPEMRAALDDAISSDIVSQLQDIAKGQTGDAKKALLDFAAYLDDRKTSALEEAIGSKAGGN